MAEMETQLQYQVDSYRFLDRTVKKMVRSWIRKEQPREIPWAPLGRSLSESTVALVSSAGLALKTDQPFDQAGERANPWWGDPSFRVLPKEATRADVGLYHLHINPDLVAQDLNTLLPLQRLQELETRGEIGASADHHYSYMGYILQPQTLLEESVPAMIQLLQQDAVDIVVLVPG
jgi:D-proline reductase (dithiol) PrdB